MTPRQRRAEQEAAERVPTPRLMVASCAAVADLRGATAELVGILDEVRREVRQVAAEQQNE